MKFTKLALTFMCSMLLFCGCAKNSDIVIKVNDEGITRGEFYSDFNKLKNVQFKQAPKEFQKDDSYPVIVLKERYVNDIILRKLLAQEFVKRNIEATAEQVEAKKKAVIEQIGSEEQLKKILKENGISEEKFNEDMVSEVKMENLANSVGNIKVTEKDAQNFYNKNKEQFKVPERAQVSHILIITNPENIKRIVTDADKQGKLSSSEIDAKVQAEVKRKEALVAEIKAKLEANPNDIAKLAKEYSEDEVTAKKGGDLGYIQKGQTEPEFEKAAFSQKIGVVGEPVKTIYGTHILIVKDKAKAGVQPYASIKQDLIKYLIVQKRNDILKNLLDGLKTNAKIEYLDPSLNPDNLRKQQEEAIKKQIEKQQNALKQKPETKLEK